MTSATGATGEHSLVKLLYRSFPSHGLVHLLVISFQCVHAHRRKCV